MPAMPNEKMQQVLDEFIAFNAPPVPSLSAENARQLPTMADAAQAAISKHAVARAMKPMPMPIGKIEHKVVPGPAGDLLLRVQTGCRHDAATGARVLSRRWLGDRNARHVRLVVPSVRDAG